MNGLLFPDQGEVYIQGVRLSADTVWDIRRKVGMVFQNPDNQFVGTTVRDDVAFGLENRGIERYEMINAINDSLEAVRMSDYLLHEPHRLSGGQKQRVAIAGVIAVKPDVIILDEATAMLDPKGRQEIMTTVNDLQETNQLSLITITHNLNEIIHSDHVIVMKDGEVWLETTPRTLFTKEEELLQIGLDVPFVAKLANAVRNESITLNQQPLNQKELLEELWTYHSSM